MAAWVPNCEILDFLLFVYFFVYIFNCLFTLSAVCLHFSTVCLLFCWHCQLFIYIFQLFIYIFHLFVYIFSCLFTFFQLFVYNFFSCLFTFLKIWIFAPKLSFSETFCHYGGLSPKLWNFETFFSVFSSFLNVQFF